MKKIVFAGAALVALAAAAPVAAQQDAPRGREAQPMTRSAVQSRVQARFVRADANRDGFVTEEEVRARAEAARGERQARRGEMRGRLFERLDANHDGSLSRAEFDARAGLRGDREQRAGRDGPRGRRLAHRGMRPGMHAGMRPGMRGALAARFGLRAFQAMDANRDGRVSLAEANAAALQRFDRVDANRDGTISLDERQAARAAMRARMMERRGG